MLGSVECKFRWKTGSTIGLLFSVGETDAMQAGSNPECHIAAAQLATAGDRESKIQSPFAISLGATWKISTKNWRKELELSVIDCYSRISVARK